MTLSRRKGLYNQVILYYVQQKNKTKWTKTKANRKYQWKPMLHGRTKVSQLKLKWEEGWCSTNGYRWWGFRHFWWENLTGWTAALKAIMQIWLCNFDSLTTYPTKTHWHLIWRKVCLAKEKHLSYWSSCHKTNIQGDPTGYLAGQYFTKWEWVIVFAFNS